MSGERANAFVADKDDKDEKKRKRRTKRGRRENGGALEWKDIIVGKKNLDEEEESMSSFSHSSEEEEEEKAEEDEGKDLDALMKTVLAGNGKGKKTRTDEEFKKSRKREASRLKRELKNVNVKENNRNFERMFIGETIVDGVGRTTRVNNTATSAGKMDDDAVEDDDENNNNNSDENKGWYYPCDWTLKTRATFAKICSLRYIYINNNKMIQYACLFIIIIDTVGVQLRELLHNLNALVLVFLLRLQLILALVPLQTRVVE